MRVSTFSVSLSASWSGAVTQAASAATSAALSQAGPSGGRPVHAAAILSVALVAAFVSLVPVEASLTGSQVPEGQSGVGGAGGPGWGGGVGAARRPGVGRAARALRTADGRDRQLPVRALVLTPGDRLLPGLRVAANHLPERLGARGGVGAGDGRYREEHGNGQDDGRSRHEPSLVPPSDHIARAYGKENRFVTCQGAVDDRGNAP